MGRVMLWRAHKYGAVRCGKHVPPHASLRECRRYDDLVIMEKAGEIRDLRQQVRIKLCDCKKRPLVYVADFQYEEHVFLGKWEWELVHEDAKGVQTPTFRLKRHLLKDKGIEVRLS